MVFYRKYRPQTFAELDNASVRDRLRQLVGERVIPHAFLFTGPKGTGKTSAARIVAKVINCQSSDKKRGGESFRNSSIEPCNTCESCISITKGTNLDVLEMDAASNRGIEEIRQLRETIRLAPLYKANKVYIIDEVHMLTTEAFNALLKTLEEPPAHAFFILATTDAHKVPATVASRCVLIQFPKAQTEDIIRALTRVVAGEKLDVEAGVLEMIAGASDGAFRDAVKVLEEARTGRVPITLERVARLIGYFPLSESEFIEHLAKRDTRRLLAITGELATQAVSFTLFIAGLLSRLHDELLGSYHPGKDVKVHFSRDELIVLLRLLSNCAVETRTSVIPELPLELAIVEWSENKTQNSLQQAQNKKLKTQTQTPVLTTSGSAQVDIWKKFIEEVKLQNQSVAAVLRSCKPLTMDGDTAIIETAYQFHFDRLKEAVTLELLAKIISQMLGKTVKIEPRLVSILQ